MVWGALIGAAAGYLMNRQSNKAQSNAASSAAQTQANAADRAAQIQADAAREGNRLTHEATMAGIDEQRRQYNTARSDQMPWLEAGRRSLSSLEGQLPYLTSQFTGNDLASSPGYQFGLDQGTGAIAAQARALGLGNSGGTMKELMRYGQDYAGTKFQEAWARDQSNKQGIYNMLAGMANTGQVTGSALAGQGAQASSSIAGLLQSGANARAGGLASAANASATGITSGANAGAAARMAAGNASAANYNNLGNIFASMGAYYDRG